MTDREIEKIRSLRKKAAKRRQILVLTLLVLTLLVLLLALGLHFSAAYALIPLSILSVVVGLGIRTSKQAMAWEKKVSAGRAHPASQASHLRKGGDDAPTDVFSAQRGYDEVKFRLGPDSFSQGVKSADIKAFGLDSGQKRAKDLESADLL